MIIKTILFLAILLGLWFWIETSSFGPFIQGEAVYEAKDYSQAMTLFQKAAAKGNAYAEFYIGVEYELGQGVSQNYPEALNWYQKSSAHGFADAQKRIEILKQKMAGASTPTSAKGKGK